MFLTFISAKSRIPFSTMYDLNFLNTPLVIEYVESGVSELDDFKLPQLLTLKYNAIADAKRELGDIGSIRETFIGFQKYLYDEIRKN